MASYTRTTESSDTTYTLMTRQLHVIIIIIIIMSFSKQVCIMLTEKLTKATTGRYATFDNFASRVLA
jgi:hypothetical protein